MDQTINVETPPKPIDVLVLFAVKEESKFFVSSRIPHLKVQSAVLGMGQENAQRRTLRALEKVQPKLVLTCGFAGALSLDLPPGRVIFDGDLTDSMEQVLLNAGARHGSFHCSQRVAVTAAEKHILYLDYRTDAVEMESGIVRDICTRRGIPSLTVRVISDAADEDLPLDFNQLVNEKFELDFRALAGSLLSSPSRIPKLILFQRRIAAVGEKLGNVLHRVMESPQIGKALESYKNFQPPPLPYADVP